MPINEQKLDVSMMYIREQIRSLLMIKFNGEVNLRLNLNDGGITSKKYALTPVSK